MISGAYIKEWRQKVPWSQNDQVEQDLIICRALKGRDLFDLWAAITTTHAQPERVIGCFLRYVEQEGHKVSRAEFEQNLSVKLSDPRFIADIGPLVVADSGFDLPRAADFVLKRLASLIPGEAWQRKVST
jgi:hypothetical protein